MYRIYTTTTTINLDSRQSAINFIYTNLLHLICVGYMYKSNKNTNSLNLSTFTKMRLRLIPH